MIECNKWSTVAVYTCWLMKRPENDHFVQFHIKIPGNKNQAWCSGGERGSVGLLWRQREDGTKQLAVRGGIPEVLDRGRMRKKRSVPGTLS